MTAQCSQAARMCSFAVAAPLLLVPLAAAADTLPASLPGVEQIVERMRTADAARSAQLEGYTATRVYQLDNHRFHKQARIKARVTYVRPGVKSFEVLSEEGSRIICDRVLKRVIATEADASHDGNRDLARINLVNYDLRVVGTETEGDRTYYVLTLEPKSKSPYLVKGRAWIDASEYALVRLEGVVAKKPSIWAGTPVVRQTYFKSGQLWLPEKNLSTTDAPVFGKTDLSIESSDYVVRTGN
jgi:outer membrane lipoprotein-sorting protein